MQLLFLILFLESSLEIKKGESQFQEFFKELYHLYFTYYYCYLINSINFIKEILPLYDHCY